MAGPSRTGHIPVQPRGYGEIRKDYIVQRTDAILRSGGGRHNRATAKELACREFDSFVAREREIAVAVALGRRE